MRRLTCLLALALFPFALTAATRDYVVLFQGKDSGGLRVDEAADGRATTRYSYRDNGRGPDLEESLHWEAAGALQSYRGAGRSTYGALIDERFERSGDAARWAVGGVPGEAAGGAAHALYLPVEGSPELLARAARQLVSAPQQQLPLLPAGQLRREDLARLDLGDRKGEARLVALHGLGLQPSLLWLDADDRLLAAIAPGWWQLVRRDLVADAKRLEAHQAAAERTMLEALAPLAIDLTGTTVLRNVRVFDSESATLGEPSDVFLERGLVTAIYPAGAPTTAAVREIDGGGRVLLPGFHDMHVHIAPADGVLHLAAGVTSVRELGGENRDVLATRDAFDRGTLLGPRVISAGYIEGESPFASRSGFVIADLPQAQQAIDWYAQRGYPQIKIYNSFPREILTETVAYAHRRGLRVSGHVPAFLRAEDVVRAGFDELQHINQVMLNFLVKDGDDTRTLLRFDLVADEAHALDLDSPRVVDFLRLLAERRVAVDPTLATFENFRQPPGAMHPSFAAVEAQLPPLLARGLRVNVMDITGKRIAPSAKSYATMVEMVGRMHRAGITLVAGSDDLPGFTFLRELELYAEAGIPPSEVLRIASWNGAVLNRTQHLTGSIAPGKYADALLVDGDPTRRISDVRRAVLVLKGGRAYRPDQLLRSQSVSPTLPSLELSASSAR